MLARCRSQRGLQSPSQTPWVGCWPPAAPRRPPPGAPCPVPPLLGSREGVANRRETVLLFGGNALLQETAPAPGLSPRVSSSPSLLRLSIASPSLPSSSPPPLIVFTSSTAPRPGTDTDRRQKQGPLTGQSRSSRAMPGTILENLSNRKLSVVIAIILIIQIFSFLMGAFIGEPRFSSPSLSLSLPPSLVSHLFSAGTGP